MKLLKINLLLTLLLCSTIGFAKNTPSAYSGFYIGLGMITSGDYELYTKKLTPNGTKIIFGETTRDGLTGELQVLDMDYSKSSIKSGELQWQGIAYSLLFYFDAGDFIFPFIKLGYQNWSSRIYASNVQNTTDNGSGIIYGFGMRIKLLGNWLLRIEHEINKIKPNDQAINLNITSFSVVTYF